MALLRSAMRMDPIAEMVWRIASADFDLAGLRGLPASARGMVEVAPVPRAVRGPHSWADQRLGAPADQSRRSGAALTEAFREGRTTPTAVLEAVLQAHADAGSRSPLVAVDEERARDNARASTERYARGEPLGPLDGLIVPIKDHLHMKGLPTRGGTRLRDTPQDTDALPVQRLEQAGAVMIGKTHATEFGLNPYGVLEHQVGPRNPYDPNRGPGGSSTGAGVSVSLGWATTTLGSDGGGSIRVPSCLTGVFGFKPTYSRVGNTGNDWAASSVSHLGPIGHTVPDLVELFALLAQPDPGDARSFWAPDKGEPAPWRQALGRGVKGARIGLLRSDWQDADPRIVAHMETALSALEAEGAELVEVELPLARVVNALGAVVIGSETAANMSDIFEEYGPLIGHELAIFVQLMRRIKANDFLMAQRTRTALRDQAAALFGDIDLLALPTTATVAPVYREDEDLTAVLDTAATSAMTRFNFLGNLTGLPAGTIPVGLVDGLPVGLQLIGDAWDEASVFAAMAHTQRLGISEAVPRPPAWLDLDL